MEISVRPPKNRTKDDISLTIVTTVRNPEVFDNNVVESTSKYKDKIQYVTLYHNSSASASLNMGLSLATEDIILCCHQDIYFKDNWYEELKKRLDELNTLDKNWGVIGFAGTTFDGKMVGTHSGLGMDNENIIKVLTLDGSVLIFQKQTVNNLKFDEKLKNFHMYDIDICLQSYCNFLFVYCVNVPIIHNTKWLAGKGLREGIEYIQQKWKGLFPTIQTTIGML